MNTRRIIRSLVLFLFIIITVIGVGMTLLMIGQRVVLEETIAPIQTSDLEDGIYTGSYNEYRWKSTLKIHVENGEITQIEIIKDHLIPADIQRTQLFNNIKSSNQLDEVDVVAGSTVTSIAYLKAVEDALSNPPE